MKKILAIAIAVTLLISVFAVFRQNVNAQAVQPSISVQPPLSTAYLGTTFSVDVDVSNLQTSQRTFGIQFKLAYDSTLLQVVNVTEGPFMQNPAWNLHGTTFIPIVEVEPVYGSVVVVGDALNPNSTGAWTAFPSGSGAIAIITFQVVSTPPASAQLPITTALTLHETQIVDDSLNDVPHADVNGSVQISAVTLSVQPSLANAYLGTTFSVDVDVSNLELSQSAIGVQFKLTYDSTLLQVVNVTEGPFMQNPDWNLHGTFFIPVVENETEYPGVSVVVVGDLLNPDPNTGAWAAFPEGSGTVATITFQVVSTPPATVQLPITTALTLHETQIVDESLNDILHADIDGAVQIFSAEPTLSVQPSLTNVVGVGSTFSVNIVASNLDPAMQVIGVQFKLTYDYTVLQVVNVTEGPLMQNSAWDLHGTTFISVVENESEYPGVSVVVIGDLLNPDSNGAWAAFPEGSGTVATITFQTIGGPADIAHSPLATALSLHETQIVDANLNDVPHTDIAGIVDIFAREPLISVQPPLIELHMPHETGTIFSVNVTVNNLDAGWRAFGIQFKLAYDNTLLQVVNVTEGPFMQNPAWNLFGTEFIPIVDVDPVFGPCVTVGDALLPNGTGAWNAFPNGNGTIATITFQVIGNPERGLNKPPLTVQLALQDVQIVDDSLNDVPFVSSNGLFNMYPTNIGDLNFDGKVDMKDIAIAAAAFGSRPGQPRWNPAADVGGFGVVDMRDIAIIARNFGWTAT